MKCKFFEKHLREYMNDELFLQMKEAMDEHLKTCSSCRALYNSELQLDQMLYKALKHEDVAFKSSRNAILDSIDKRKYSKSYLSKIKYSLIKNKYRVGSTLTAAILAFIILTSQGLIVVSRQTVKEAASNKPQAEQNGIASIQEDNSAAKDTAKEEKATESIRIDNAELLDSLDAVFGAYSQKEIPEFVITDRAADDEFIHPSSWKNSSSNNLSALLDGRGEMNSDADASDGIRGMDEGIATIVVKDNKLNQYKNLNIRSEKLAQITPRYIEWVDDSNLLVTIGQAYGMVALGGPLYLLNINTGKTMLIYEPEDTSKQFVITAIMQEGQLKLKEVVYTDDIMNEYQVEEKYINFKDISPQEDASGLMDKFQGFIERKDYEGINKLFTDDYEPLAKDALGSLKSIEAVKINKLIRVDNYLENNQLESYGFEDMITYCIEMDYSLGKNYTGNLVEGINYQYMILTKTIGSEEWHIAYIYTVS